MYSFFYSFLISKIIDCTIDVSSITVVAGTLKSSGNDGQSFEVPKKNIYTHLGYDPNILANDVAILKLPAPVTLSQYSM